MQKTLATLVLIFTGFVIWYASLLWMNNRVTPLPDNIQLSASLKNAINWMETNVDEIEENNNPQVWWMIKQASEVSGNPRLVSIYKIKEAGLLNMQSLYIWKNMFDNTAYVGLPSLQELHYLPSYNYLFLYGLTCDLFWEVEPEVQRQLNPGLCSMHFFHPRCVTHQIMGLRFMQRSNCGDPDQRDELIRGLQNIILQELTWDTRVVDAYIQRVLTLVDSGAANRVKPAWINRILDAQNDDGGWGDFDPIITFPNGVSLGFASTRLVFDKPQSNLHATAQAIWLICLLLAQ